MPIMGISDFRRLPRLGKIKLGKKDKTKNGAPYQTEYFVCPEEIQEIYGPEPTELDVMFPVNDIEIVFPQYYKKYGKTGLHCKGDGRNATYMKDGELVEKDCTPGECKGCKPVGTLNILLPKVSGFGVWQIWTSSWNSIVNLNSSIEMISAMTRGRFAYIPLKLVLQEHNAVVKTSKGQFQKKVYVMSINSDLTMGEFYQRHSFDMQVQRGIQENKNFAELVDTAKKIESLNEPKQDEHIELDDDYDEFVESKALEGEVIEDESLVGTPLDDYEYEGEPVCSECGVSITQAQKKLSEHKFGRQLCVKCQYIED